MNTINLAGKRALVGGASQGIGRACAEALAEAGCEIIALARDEKNLTELMQTLPSAQGQRHACFTLDLSDEQALANLIKQNANIRECEIFIANAGGPSPGLISQATRAQFVQAFNMHLFANLSISQALLPYMQAKNYGRIINILSTSIKSPIEGLGVSNVTRAAVAAWAKTMSYEVAQYGVTVNNILPGSIATDRMEEVMRLHAEQAQSDFATFRQQSLNKIPAKRFGETQEVAQAVLFLASPLAAYINGINLPVDGGNTRVL